MNLLRPRYLALAFAAYFGAVGYYAWQAARRAGPAAYSPEIAQAVFQTTMVGGVLILLGIFITASISPHIKGGPPSRQSLSFGAARVIRRIRGDSTRTLDDFRMRGGTDSAWPAGDEFLEEPSDSETSAYRDLEQAQDAAAVSAALSRMVPTGEAPAAGTLAERLSGMRARSTAVLISEGRETAGGVVPPVHNMETLLAAAEKVGLDLPDVRRPRSGAAARHGRKLSARVRVVQPGKGRLEAALVERIAESFQHVLVDNQRSKASTRPGADANLITP